jgi:hypothetical protein
VDQDLLLLRCLHSSEVSTINILSPLLQSNIILKLENNKWPILRHE